MNDNNSLAHTSWNCKYHISITLNNDFVIHDISVLSNNNRLYVAFPTRLEDDGIYHSVVKITSLAVRDKLETSVLDEFNRYALTADNM